MHFSVVDGGIKAECVGPLDRVSLGRWSIRYRLDSKTHLPAEILTDGRWDRYKETQSVIVTAKATVRHDEDWVTKFTAEAAKYFEATGTHKRAQQRDVVALATAEREKPGAAGEILDARKARLIAARDAVTVPIFRADLDRRIKQCDEFRDSRVETAKSWAKIAGLSAPDWKIADLAGKEHSLAQIPWPGRRAGFLVPSVQLLHPGDAPGGANGGDASPGKRLRFVFRRQHRQRGGAREVRR